MGVTLAVIGAVVAEWAGASAGLGVLINIANQGLFDTPLMFVALATLAVIGITLHGLVVVAERRLTRIDTEELAARVRFWQDRLLAQQPSPGK